MINARDSKIKEIEQDQIEDCVEIPLSRKNLILWTRRRHDLCKEVMGKHLYLLRDLEGVGRRVEL